MSEQEAICIGCGELGLPATRCACGARIPPVREQEATPVHEQDRLFDHAPSIAGQLAMPGAD